MEYFLLVAAAALGGLALGYYFRYLYALKLHARLDTEIENRRQKADKEAQNIIEEAEEKAHDIAAAARKTQKEIEDKLEKKENRLTTREEILDSRYIELESEKESIRSKISEIKSLHDALKKKEASVTTTLEEIASLSYQEAHAILIEKIEKEYGEDLYNRIQKLERAGEEAYQERAQSILLSAIQRLGNNIPTTILTAHVPIESDELKGKIIGREGRNVRAFEHITGVDVLIDDTPGYITLSSFDPIRREIAKTALENLLKDGRIQPARIETEVKEAEMNVHSKIKEMGKKAAYEANVASLPSPLLEVLGRLYFRTSYGQNVLHHSVEVAQLSAMIASEIGANVNVARAGGLVHDIGKIMSHEVSGSHVDIGIRILQKYEVGNEIILAMRSHHDEYPYETPESVIVQVADAISGGRPGARRDSIENYLKRLGELEAIATQITGVEKAFAVSAGREIRVLVNPEQLSDLEAHTLAKTIANSIEMQLRYPGEIKVHVIRETRTISYAR